MKTTEILTQYANEDLNLLIEEGCMSITGTKKGLLNLEFENNIFTIQYNNYSSTFQTPDKECVIDFLINSYKLS